MNNDEKLKAFGNEVLEDVYSNDKTDSEWEYISAVCYGLKVTPSGGEAHSFFSSEILNGEEYETIRNGKYPDKTEEEIWEEFIKPEIVYCLNKITKKTEVETIFNKY